MTIKKFTEKYGAITTDRLKEDYLRNIVTKKNGRMIERNDVKNDELWDTERIKYVEDKFN